MTKETLHPLPRIRRQRPKRPNEDQSRTSADGLDTFALVLPVFEAGTWTVQDRQRR
jgi:hypothetical protein